MEGNERASWKKENGREGSEEEAREANGRTKDKDNMRHERGEEVGEEMASRKWAERENDFTKSGTILALCFFLLPS